MSRASDYASSESRSFSHCSVSEVRDDRGMNEERVEEFGLKVSDRCDLCGAQAFVEVVMESGKLLFCGHHARKFQNSYSKTAVKVNDYTHLLQA